MKTVYGGESCYKCKQLVKELEEKGEEFKYVDVYDLKDEEILVLINKHGPSLPIVIE